MITESADVLTPVSSRPSAGLETQFDILPYAFLNLWSFWMTVYTIDTIFPSRQWDWMKFCGTSWVSADAIIDMLANVIDEQIIARLCLTDFIYEYIWITLCNAMHLTTTSSLYWYVENILYVNYWVIISYFLVWIFFLLFPVYRFNICLLFYFGPCKAVCMYAYIFARNLWLVGHITTDRKIHFL